MMNNLVNVFGQVRFSTSIAMKRATTARCAAVYLCDVQWADGACRVVRTFKSTVRTHSMQKWRQRYERISSKGMMMISLDCNVEFGGDLVGGHADTQPLCRRRRL